MHRRMRRCIVLLGSVRPAWVAAGAIIDEDFVNGLYWPRPITSEILDTRASAKYVTDAAGLLIPVLANVIPISNAGMLIEPARTNVLQNSAVLNGAPWADASTGTTTRTANAAVAPDGTTTATQLVGNDANTYWFSGFQSGAYQSTNVTISVYMRTATPVTISIKIIFNGGNTYSQNVNVTTVWQRFTFTQATIAGDTQNIAFATNIGSGNTIFAWGAQLEVAATVSSFITTTAAGVTRAADSAVIQRTGIGRIVFTFDDASQQTVSGINAAAQYTIPTNLNRPLIKRLTGYAS